jgi:excisionase family DNA binding protein
MYKVGVAARSTGKPSEMLTIKGAAEILGVSEMTLRRWDESGKFRARRHPINGYRLYRRRDVVRLRQRITGVRRGAAA